MRILMRLTQFGRVLNDPALLIWVPVRIALSGFRRLLDIDRSSQTLCPFVRDCSKEVPVR
jgi:hypothetical protein